MKYDFRQLDGMRVTKRKELDMFFAHNICCIINRNDGWPICVQDTIKKNV